MMRASVAALVTTVLFILACSGAPIGPDRAVSMGVDAAEELGTVVTVLYFDNNTNDVEYDVFGKGLADMMITDLSGVDGMKVVERAKLQALIDELNLQQSEFFDPATAQKLGSGLGATHAITGSISAFAPQLRIDIRLIDVTTSEVVMADKVAGQNDDLFGLQEELADKFVEAFDKKRSESSVAENVQDADLLLECSKGLDSADKGDLERASQLLGGVVQSAPDFGLAKDRLGDVEERLEESRKRRDTILNARAQARMVKIEENLSKDVLTLSGKAAEDYFASRETLGNLFVDEAAKLLQEPKDISELSTLEAIKMSATGSMLKKTIPKAEQDKARELLTMYVENAALGASERKAYIASGKPVPGVHRFGQEKAAAAWKAGFSDNEAMEMANIVIMGRLPDAFHGSVPTGAELNPAVIPLVLGALTAAEAPTRAHEDPGFAEVKTIRLWDLHGDVLLELGREEEAIVMWQKVLDEYPTCDQYDAVEAKIRDNA